VCIVLGLATGVIPSYHWVTWEKFLPIKYDT
jgi:hypothetical protein